MLSDQELTVTLSAHLKGLSYPSSLSWQRAVRSGSVGGRVLSCPILSLSPMRRPNAGFSHLTLAKVPSSPWCSTEDITWAAGQSAGDPFPG